VPNDSAPGISVTSPALQVPDGELFRHVLGHYPTGVAVITAMTADGPVGMAVNSFTSVSLDPPLILFCPAVSSSTWPLLQSVGQVAINVLSAGQEPVSRLFARKDVDRFASISWTAGENGAPLLHDALGWLECTVEAEVPAGDHTVVTAAITRMGVHDEIVAPLLFFRGSYYAGVAAAAEADD
jgi:3-hydroxy-9,10-secoandrosta-1,3,5(10)-triene-9,17-dione monooxygenase reductase component